MPQRHIPGNGLELPTSSSPVFGSDAQRGGVPEPPAARKDARAHLLASKPIYRAPGIPGPVAMFRAEVRVELKHGVTDPEGENTEKALQLLGYDSVEDVHSSTIYRIDLDEDTREGARSRVEEMCERLLANPVIHDYSIDVAEA